MYIYIRTSIFVNSKILVMSDSAALDFYFYFFQGHVKLAKFGLYHMTAQGVDVDFPIG